MYLERQIFLVFGLSRSGVAVAEYLIENAARVYIYDDLESEVVKKNILELEKLGAKRVQKEKIDEMHEICDVLVLSPGVPIDHKIAIAFRKNGKAVVGETEIAARVMKCSMIAVTGTNGKTTTVSMIGKLLKDGGKKAEICGNIGTPMIKFTNRDEKTIAVAEISSFQLETLSSLIPHVAIILNISEDHLNRHYRMENYIYLKKKLLKNSTEMEYVVLNWDDEIVREFSDNLKAHVLWFSIKERVLGAYLMGEYLYFGNEKIMPISELLIDGVHNIANALASICAAKIMGIPNDIIRKSLSDFKGARHRIEFVGNIDGVEYIDDSKGTNVDATITAISCMKKETILLLGGKDKGYNYESLFQKIIDSKIVNVIIYGENRDKIYESAKRIGYKNVVICLNFEMAMEIADRLAKSGQTILLSPASASFDEFESYEERGDKFVSFVLKKEKTIESKKAEAKEYSEEQADYEREQMEESRSSDSDHFKDEREYVKEKTQKDDRKDE